MKKVIKNTFSFVKRRWYFVLILVVAVGLYLNQQKTAQAKKEKESTYTIKRQDLRDVLSLSGKINADEHSTLRFQSSGKLAWVGVKEGDVVKKYQTIAALDQRDVKMRLQKSLNTYAQTRNNFDQSGDDNQRIGDQPTKESGDKMKRLLEDAQYDLKSAVLDVELNSLAIEYANLWTPIDGIVIRADAKYAGMNITPSQAEFEIVNPQTIYFSFIADQTEVIKLKENMEGTISFDSYPDETVQGHLYYISYTPQEGETGTVYEGRLKLEGADAAKYRYGMTGDVEFLISQKNNVVAIPSNFVKSDDKGKYVYKMVQEKKVKTYLSVGPEIDGSYEIKKGLAEGDTISIASSP